VKGGLFVVGLLLSVPSWAVAWPAETMPALSRDARKLLPRSLSRLLGGERTRPVAHPLEDMT